MSESEYEEAIKSAKRMAEDAAEESMDPEVISLAEALLLIIDAMERREEENYAVAG